MSIHLQIAKQSVALIATLPNAIDQPLIQRVYREHVFALCQIRRQIDLVVIVLKMVRGRRTLPDKRAAHVQHVVIVCRDENARVLGFFRQRKVLAEEHVLIAVCGAIQRQRFQLAVKYVARLQRGKLCAGDPFSGELM